MAQRLSILVFVAMLSLLAMIAPSIAVQPDEILADSAMETRARAMSAQLRCLVCQNQSIDDSNAPLARDLRLLVRERLQAGDSDQAVMDYVVARYGEFVLLKPPFNAATLLLWLTPLLALLAAGWMVRSSWQSGRQAATAKPFAALTAEERKKLDEVLGNSRPE